MALLGIPGFERFFVLEQLFLVNIHHARDAAGAAALVRLRFAGRRRFIHVHAAKNDIAILREHDAIG
jgi:hypothetical protein